MKIKLSGRNVNLHFKGLFGLKAGCQIFQKNLYSDEWEPAIVMGFVSIDGEKFIVTVTPEGVYQYGNKKKNLLRVIRIYSCPNKKQKSFTPEKFLSLYDEFSKQVEVKGEHGIQKMLMRCHKINFR
ncbi:hypothetical protein KAI56_00210 [Candidatus Parcubacteria bacterium]|nr:hypothetical protein [Candidatus Parcubacteria bacterium]